MNYLVTKTPLEPIYEKYGVQIDTIVEELDHNYNRAATIISWLYGGSPESWRKFLPKQKSHTTPKEVKDFFKNLGPKK